MDHRLCGHDSVRVYESMNVRLSSSLIELIADFLHARNDYIIIEYANMKCKCGSDDCGLFAIASARAFCH